MISQFYGWLLIFLSLFVMACMAFGTFNVFRVIGIVLGAIVLLIGAASFVIGFAGMLLLCYALTITYGPLIKFGEGRHNFQQTFRG